MNAQVVTRSVLQAVEETQLSVDSGKQHLSPFVKWAGGKTSLLPHLIPRVPLHLTEYYEPFLGGGALFFVIYARTTGFKAHLSDTNQELIAAYRVIRESPEELLPLLSRLQGNNATSVDKC